MFLFDTDTLSNVVKKDPPPKLLMRLANIPSEDQFTTTITIGEMVYGAHRNDRPAHFLDKLHKKILPNLTLLSFDEPAAYEYGRLRAELEKEGKPISEPVLRIASIALVNNLTLITGNIGYFFRISHLKIENWLED